LSFGLSSVLTQMTHGVKMDKNVAPDQRKRDFTPDLVKSIFIVTMSTTFEIVSFIKSLKSKITAKFYQNHPQSTPIR